MATTLAHHRLRDAARWLLLALIFSLPLMKLAVAYPVVLTDLIFVLAGLAYGVAVLAGRTDFRWRGEYWVLLAYALCLAPSLFASSDLAASSVKLLSEFYLIGLAILTAALVTSKDALRRATLAWLAGTAVVALVGVASLLVFAWAPASPLIDFVRYDFGTLPPGNYPRFALTFFDGNMLCNYLTASLGMLLLARERGWLPALASALLGTGILLAALSTISPGLGGIVLVPTVWIWLKHRRNRPRLARLSLAAGLVVAALFVAVLSVTPILHPTAPFLIHVPGTHFILAPSGRFLTWSAALAEFARHPLVGHGLGIGAVYVRYLDPSGNLQLLTDAHDMFLNIAAQCGLVGLAGLGALLVYVWRRYRHGTDLPIALLYFNLFVYQGLGGSFEDARHIWVLLGLLMAHHRISRQDENSRRVAAPSPG
jgi:O-antigen ligase